VTSQGDWIEFYNPGDEPIDIGGYSFVDEDYPDPEPFHRYIFGVGQVVGQGGGGGGGGNGGAGGAASVILGPGEYLVVTNVKDEDFDFGLGGDDLVRLYDPDMVEVDIADWPDDGALVSYCRFPDGGPFEVDCTQTEGATNMQ
jgi:hypothetical protein